uniref:TPR_REGION domain-containing protein n=1 Tax=Caenorhabditis tropicalis TaxID=1561998 RepID=A0A1I7TKV4_9PELO
MKRKIILMLLFAELINAFDNNESRNEYETGNEFFVKRKYNDALTHYHKAIEIEPSNYLALFRRATNYLVLGRTKPGLADLNTVLEQKPDFVVARQQRANVLTKMGKLVESADDYHYLIATSSLTGLEEKLDFLENKKMNSRVLITITRSVIAELLRECLLIYWKNIHGRFPCMFYERTAMKKTID